MGPNDLSIFCIVGSLQTSFLVSSTHSTPTFVNLMESRQKVTQTTSISSTSWYAETHGADLSNQTLGIFTKICVFDKLGDVTWSNYQRLIDQ